MSIRTLPVGLPLLAFVLLTALLPAQREQRAQELLDRMTLEEKAGQLFMSWILSRPDGQDEKREQMRHWIREAGLGGVILSLGGTADAALLVRDLQGHAKVPLLMAGDFEGGVAFRLRGATEMGNQMLVGATGLTRLAHAMGQVTGVEAKALGFHWVFAPVLDVQSNPANPIINVRSFGEDPELVARLGSAVAAGIRREGLLPCGKHFPGHGDVSTDSHLALPTVPGDAERLRRVELLPFRLASAAGLEAVMTGHLSVPGLGEHPAVPATLSARILGEVLRDQVGFRGIVVTDALDMGGVRNARPPAEVAVAALAAGADLLLMPPDPIAARDAVVAAVQAGTVSRQRLDSAVLRILTAKQRVGLLDGRGQVDPQWMQHVGHRDHAAVADEIAQRGLTLVRDRHGDLPLRRGAAAPLVVHLCDAGGAGEASAAGEPRGAVCTAELQQRLAGATAAVLDPRSTQAQIEAVTGQVAAAGTVVLGLHVKVRSYSGQIGVPPQLRPVLAALRDAQTVIAVSFGNPYLLRDLPQADVYLCAFDSSARLERAVVRALCGEAPITGRLPVALPDLAAVGTGLTMLPGDRVTDCEPAREGLAADLPAQVRALLEQGVRDRVFPGAICAVARRGQRVLEVAVGRHTYDEDASAVRATDRFDLASLTKVCATTPLVLRLVAAGKLSFDDPVQQHVPEFTGPGKDRVTVRHLLAHCSGLPAYVRFHEQHRDRDAVLAAAVATPLAAAPGEKMVYSDLGFMLLMLVAERTGGGTFAALAQREVFDPFGLGDLQFATGGQPVARAVPTEVDAARGGLLRGRVHDENAFAMGGVSGHAGLFGTADDVLRYGVAMLAGGRGVLPRPLVDEAVRAATLLPESGRGLGFQCRQPAGWMGSEVPPATFGHTGFTGTSLWCEPQRDLCVVLLSNRVHPTRDNPRILELRRALHDLVRRGCE